MAYDPRKDAEETFTKDTGLPGSALPPGPGYVLDPNGKIVVGDSTYYPSTTNGKLDLFSKTVAVENPTVAAKAAQDSPFGVLDQQAGTLKTRFLEQAKRLRDQNLPPEQHNKILAGMQADYDNEKYKLSDVKTQLDGIQSAIESGIVDPTLGQQTQWKIAAPHMAGAFGSGEARGRFGPESVASFKEVFAGDQTDAITLGSTPGSGVDVPTALKNQYLKDRKMYSYSTQMNKDQQQAFDMAWDDSLADDPNNGKLWQDMLRNDPQLYTSRTRGSQLLDVASQKATGYRVSPFAQGINQPAETADSRIGTIVTKGGKQWKIVNIDADGEPLVEAVR